MFFNNKILNQIYNLSDLIAVPSFHENLSNTILESLSSGAPVVAFKIGGNAELIDHKKNGYLAEFLNEKDLARGISWVLENLNNSNLNINSRERAEKYFSEEVIVKKYIGP